MNLLLTLPLGLLIGMALGALGGGGSILAVPALVYVVGLEPKAAVTTSLVVVGVTALGATVGHWRAGHVRVTAGLWFGIAGIGGSLVGSRLNRAVDPRILLIAFSALMLVAAWRMWVSAGGGRGALGIVPRPGADGPARTSRAEGAVPVPPFASARPERRPLASSRSMVVTVIAAGTVVGFMTGFFGVGGGFIIVPALVLTLGFDMPDAVGTSLLVIAINSGTALVTRLASTGIDWRVAVPFTIAGLAGALVGGRLARRAPPAILARWFAALLVVVALYTLGRSIAG